jgi:putative DNA primase/helicase
MRSMHNEFKDELLVKREDEMGKCTMKAIDISPQKFLSAFFSPEENVCVRIFSDKKSTGYKGQNISCKSSQIEKYIPGLKEDNSNNRGIFFVVNYGGHEDKQIKRINAQFVENDTVSIKEQYKRLMSFPLEPSIIVKTKKSLHGYWLIKDGQVPLFREVQKRLAHYFQGDKSIVNESRVLRFPGFFHCKEEPVMVGCIKFNPELKYTQEELFLLCPKGEGEAPSTQKPAGNKKGIELVTSRCDFIKYCKEKAETLPEQHWYAMITNLAVFQQGAEVIHELSKPYPGYSQAETDDKIEHFLKSETKPITCRTIVERGFNCSKLESGECSCKSPAALVYVPVDLEVLSAFLSKEPVTKNATRNVTKASQFIKNYLSNIDAVIAKSFISSEIKQYFDLNERQVKSLLAMYRELLKSNRDSKQKTPKGKGDLPDWYERVENGLRFIPGILAYHMSKNIDAFYGAEEFYSYDNGVYKQVHNLVAARMVRDHIFDKYATASGINDTLTQWQILIHKPVDIINSNPYIINVKNGLYNVLEDKLLEHTPEYYSTVQMNANYDKEAQCPRFMEFLNECLYPEDIPLVQEIIGYLLIPVNRAQKSFVFVGAGHAGKSTLLSVAQDILLGNSNVSNVPWQALSDRFKTAELFGKLANIFADLPSKSFDDNGLFKSITGEDYITAEKKNKPPFSFRPYARLLFSCNEIPKNYGDRSSAFYRRLIIIRFSKPIPVEKRDVHLKDKLALEADGIFMWALEGLKRLIKNHYVFSESERAKEELNNYRIESNSILSFVQDNCILDEDKCTEFQELYRKYKEYCEESGLHHVAQKTFSKEFRENYPEISSAKDGTSRRVVFKGIGLA